MKKLCNLFIFWLCAVLSFAQIQVVSTGNVGVGDTLSVDRKLFVTAEGDYDCGIYSYIKSSKPWGPAISARAEFLTDRQIAIYGYAGNSSPYESGRAYGVYGSAGNRTSGYNYGVYGELSGTNDGTGIYGTTSSLVPMIQGRYAGYFYGNVYTVGKITAKEFTTLFHWNTQFFY